MRGKLVIIIAWWVVIADGEVWICFAVGHDHSGAAVNRDTADLCRCIPDELSQVAHFRKQCGVDGVFLVPRLIEGEFILVPRLSDGCGSVLSWVIVGVDVLAIARAVGDIVLPFTLVGAHAGIVFAISTPSQRLSAVIRASTIVMPKHGVLIFSPAGQVCLLFARSMSGVDSLLRQGQAARGENGDEISREEHGEGMPRIGVRRCYGGSAVSDRQSL